MLFWRKKKKLVCEHEWHHVKDDYITINMGGMVDTEDGCWIFCPKCRTEELVYENEWLRIKKKQEIIKNYVSSNRLISE